MSGFSVVVVLIKWCLPLQRNQPVGESQNHAVLNKSNKILVLYRKWKMVIKCMQPTTLALRRMRRVKCMLAAILGHILILFQKNEKITDFLNIYIYLLFLKKNPIVKDRKNIFKLHVPISDTIWNCHISINCQISTQFVKLLIFNSSFVSLTLVYGYCVCASVSYAYVVVHLCCMPISVCTSVLYAYEWVHLCCMPTYVCVCGRTCVICLCVCTCVIHLCMWRHLCCMSWCVCVCVLVLYTFARGHTCIVCLYVWVHP